MSATALRRVRTDQYELTILLLAAGMLVVASWLPPSPRGYGTHTRLGLPPCTFHLLTGLKCPLCGMTTGICHMARGQWREAWHCHVLAPVVYCLAVLQLPFRGYRLLGGKWNPFERLSLRREFALLLAVLLLTGWALNLALQGRN